MMGCGTGAVIEPHLIEKLPSVKNRLVIKDVSEIGLTNPQERKEKTEYDISGNQVLIKVGDSRRGWVDSYQLLLELSSSQQFETNTIDITIDLSDVRPVGESLKGFGGMANPVKLKDLYKRIATLLNKAIVEKQ
jgi:ribonucleotide reductase class II